MTMFFGTGNLPTRCRAFISTLASFFKARFEARWVSAAARIAAGTMAGCTFMCGAVDCKVQGSDGLPVELLTFGVE